MYTVISYISTTKTTDSTVKNAIDVFKNDDCFQMHMDRTSEGGKCTCDMYFKRKDCSQTVHMNRHKIHIRVMKFIAKLLKIYFLKTIYATCELKLG